MGDRLREVGRPSLGKLLAKAADADGHALSVTAAGPASSQHGMEVNLSFSGGWNVDLYAYLVHDSGFSVLLNRPGA